ncbi:MAG: hypothetical protein PVH68_02240 [Armatimonadota bacterium]|jgi:hypothetical protein
MPSVNLRTWPALGIMAALTSSAVSAASGPEAPLEASALVGCVEALPPEALLCRSTTPRARRLMRIYFRSLLDWDAILLERMQPVPERPGCGYYGRSGHAENDIRPIAYAALVNAFLAEAQPPGGVTLSAGRRARMRQDAVAALRYLVQGHVTGGGTCANGRQWGNQWQSAMWSRSVGQAAWMLWRHLDAELQAGAARLVQFEADRFLRLKPKSSEFRDTGAEENAWNAQILSLACNMLPRHPRAPRWGRAAKRWMYNSLSVALDAEDESVGDDGRRVRDWVSTVNVHPDFTLENHGIVHLGYLKTSVAMLIENAVPYLLAGGQPPEACLHHARDCLSVVFRCMGWDGGAIYFSGDDWKSASHRQNTDVMLFALMALLAQDRDAAYWEQVALTYARRLQRAEGGFYNVRRDLEFGGLCASRIVACCLARARLGAGPSPARRADVEQRLRGVTYLEHGQVIVHRTPTRFASFSWGPKRMALALPRNGSWVLWPHFASYTGLINGADASAARAELKRVRHHVGRDSFSVTGALARLDGAVEQAFSFTSLPADVTVYIERLTPGPDFAWQSRETGVLGLEYDIGRNERTLYGRHGATRAVGVGGAEARVVVMDTDWLNIGGRVGYVVKRWPEGANVMRYHDEVSGSGRVPKLQEWLSLVGQVGSRQARSGADWACVVTFLNQGSGQTPRAAARVRFTVAKDVALCDIGRNVVRVDFGAMHTDAVREGL